MSLLKEINEIPSSKADLRKFGLTMAGAFGLFGGIALWRGHGFYVYLLGASACFLVFGLVFPAVLRPVQKVWMTLALLMGWVMSRVILTLLFFIGVTPIGLFLRITGKDILDKKSGVKRDSYWAAHKPRAKEDYENQF
jgi:hypothetical protein